MARRLRTRAYPFDGGVDDRIVLVQIVHSENIESSADEMASALKSLIVY